MFPFSHEVGGDPHMFIKESKPRIFYPLNREATCYSLFLSQATWVNSQSSTYLQPWINLSFLICKIGVVIIQIRMKMKWEMYV